MFVLKISHRIHTHTQADIVLYTTILIPVIIPKISYEHHRISYHRYREVFAASQGRNATEKSRIATLNTFDMLLLSH